MDKPGNAADMLQQLTQVEAFPDETTTVQRVETHISWVFLTDRFVYKLKKPVHFEFLDFSTLRLRQRACLLEQELNQRLAPQVYLGVVPVTRDSQGRIAVRGKGEVIEWAVRMRRLPADAALDVRLRQGQLAKHELRRIAEYLCHFYDRQPPVQLLTEDYHRAVLAHVRANRDELLRPEHALDRDRVMRVHAAQLRFLHLQEDILDNRVCDGRIVEGHGDLRPEHIYLTPTPVVIDCIEFSSELRQLDVLDELSFLAMECDRLGAPDVGRQLLDYYQDAAQDPAPEALVAYYKSYRAAVRAKVTALRGLQQEGEARRAACQEAEAYMALADRYLNDLYPPVVFLVHGRSGVGKSTIAAALAEKLGFVHLQTDILRQELFPRRNGEPPDSDEMYSAKNRQRVYSLMAERAEEFLCARVSLVLDGTFLAQSQRDLFSDLATRYGAVVVQVHCSCPLEVARQRIAGRLEHGPRVSDAWPELPGLQQEADDVPARSLNDDRSPRIWNCEIDTRRSLPDMLSQIVEMLRKAILPTGTSIAP